MLFKKKAQSSVRGHWCMYNITLCTFRSRDKAGQQTHWRRVMCFGFCPVWTSIWKALCIFVDPSSLFYNTSPSSSSCCSTRLAQVTVERPLRMRCDPGPSRAAPARRLTNAVPLSRAVCACDSRQQVDPLKLYVLNLNKILLRICFKVQHEHPTLKFTERLNKC